MTLKTWAVVDKKTGLVTRMFEERAQANYYVTDCYGPEWNKVFIMETCEPLINVEFDEVEIGEKFVHIDGHTYIKISQDDAALCWDDYILEGEDTPKIYKE